LEVIYDFLILVGISSHELFGRRDFSIVGNYLAPEIKTPYDHDCHQDDAGQECPFNGVTPAHVFLCLGFGQKIEAYRHNYRTAIAAPMATVNWGATMSISVVCCGGSAICKDDAGFHGLQSTSSSVWSRRRINSDRAEPPDIKACVTTLSC